MTAEACGAELEVVICTYDNPDQLDATLAALARQEDAGAAWSVLVVDNNSGPETARVVEIHRSTGRIPGLRRVVEFTQGLTPARSRGIRETSARWIALVDDDCELATDWIAHAVEFLRARPDVAGFGGRVVPTYAAERAPFLDRRGWVFAEQDRGDAVREVSSLVGAGMVIRRDALAACGWIDEQLFEDRIGRRLVSGGDVEIALRLASVGPLAYVPSCELRHHIPIHRTGLEYLTRLVHGLGISAALAHALAWPNGRARWVASAGGHGVDAGGKILRAMAGRMLRRRSADDARLTIGYEVGRCRGILRVAMLLAIGRCRFFGRAATTRTPASAAIEATSDTCATCGE
jgi:glucosyl-dolichyl phosphate glucuronosyltransferase